MLKKLSYLCLLVISFGAYSQNFPMKKMLVEDWTAKNWMITENLNASNLRKSAVSTKGDILFSKTEGATLVSKEKFGDLKFSFDFIQSEDAELHIGLQNGINLIITEKANSPWSGSVVHEKTKMNAYQNAAKAPGLWQHLELEFSLANTQNKYANVSKVILNGITILENHLVYLPTPEKDFSINLKQISGISGIKNLEYLTFVDAHPINIENLHYKITETSGWQDAYKPTGKVVEKSSNELTANVPNEFKDYLITFSGDLLVENAGEYAFTTDFQGYGNFYIDGKEVSGSAEIEYRKPISGITQLTAGKHAFEYQYRKTWWRPAFGLFVSSPNFRPYALHAANALPSPPIANGIFVNVVGEKAKTIRGFMNHQGKKHTEVISVGTAQNIHYAFDLATGSMLKAWKGQFADVTEMWHERGEPQVLEPLGLKTEFNGKPSFFKGKTPLDSIDVFNEMVFKSYVLDKNGLPTYKYHFMSTPITQTFTPEKNALKVQVKADGAGVKHVLAEANNLIKLSETSFLVDDKIINYIAGPKVEVLENAGKKYLVALCGNTLTYSINW